MEEYDAALIAATDYFLNAFFAKELSAPRPSMPTFKRWMSICYGLEVDWDERTLDGSIIVVNVRDAELATMFKLRF